jgi:hypothetical protein
MKFERQFLDSGLIDSVILAVQEEKRCMVLTGDPHFEEMNDIVFLE